MIFAAIDGGKRFACTFDITDEFNQDERYKDIFLDNDSGRFFVCLLGDREYCPSWFVDRYL